MPRFAEQVEVAIEALSTNPPQPFEENEFIDASRLVYDGVRDIRKAVLMIRVRPPSLRRSIAAAPKTECGASGAPFLTTADGGSAPLTFHQISPVSPDPPCELFLFSNSQTLTGPSHFVLVFCPRACEK